MADSRLGDPATPRLQVPWRLSCDAPLRRTGSDTPRTRDLTRLGRLGRATHGRHIYGVSARRDQDVTGHVCFPHRDSRNPSRRDFFLSDRHCEYTRSNKGLLHLSLKISTHQVVLEETGGGGGMGVQEVTVKEGGRGGWVGCRGVGSGTGLECRAQYSRSDQSTGHVTPNIVESDHHPPREARDGSGQEGVGGEDGGTGRGGDGMGWWGDGGWNHG